MKLQEIFDSLQDEEGYKTTENQHFVESYLALAEYPPTKPAFYTYALLKELEDGHAHVIGCLKGISPRQGWSFGSDRHDYMIASRVTVDPSDPARFIQEGPAVCMDVKEFGRRWQSGQGTAMEIFDRFVEVAAQMPRDKVRPGISYPNHAL